MWPKMLLELLPHFTRLVPLADKYFSTRPASEKAHEAALAALSIEMRSELARGFDKQADVLRLLQDQNVQLAGVALDATRTRMGVEALEIKVARLETSLATADARTAHAVKLLAAVLLAVFIAVVLILVILIVRTAH
jgi:hypothetical protein